MDSKIIVALDVSSRSEAISLYDTLSGVVHGFKIGLEAVSAGYGLQLARDLASYGEVVMLDTKLHDIPETVRRSARELASTGATYITAHAYPQTLRAAVEGVEDTRTQVIGVTVLTSMSNNDLNEAGYGLDVETSDLVMHRADMARATWTHGLVCSPHEVGMLRNRWGGRFTLITPGVRPESSGDDQKRTGTPEQAVRDGADYIVVGRPITRAESPRNAAIAINMRVSERDQT